MRINWGLIIILISSVWVWYAVFRIGFLHTLFWIVLGALLGGLTTKLWEKRNDYTKYIG